MEKITYRNGKQDDLPGMKALFAETIYSVCSKDYENRQIEAWASGVENKERWERLTATQFVLVAQEGKNIVGFITLAENSHIDMLYIHKNYQHQGIAKNLYAAIEIEAIRKNQREITADVSKTALSFFEKAGFKVMAEQKVVRNGTELTNFRMKKELI